MSDITNIVNNVTLEIVMRFSMEDIETYLCTNEESAITLEALLKEELEQMGIKQWVLAKLAGISTLPEVSPIIKKLGISLVRKFQDDHYSLVTQHIATANDIGGVNWEKELIFEADKQFLIVTKIQQSLNKELKSWLETHTNSNA